MRTILHVDMDAFFAAIELLRHPELKGRPLVVGGSGDPMARGVVSTANYEARRYGIRSGMPLRTAFGLCPEAVFLPVDYEHYMAVSERFKPVLRSYGFEMEELGLDEAFLDISERETDPLALGRRIKAAIKQATGLTASVGIGPNKLLAKIASDLEKPDGLTRLTMEDLPTRVWPLPVQTLWGVGPKTAARLAEFGVNTVGELASIAQQTLVQRFGPAHGEHLYRSAHGIDDSPLITHWERKSIGHETTFQHDVSNYDFLLETLGELLGEVMAALHREALKAGSVTVKLRYSDFETHTHTQTLKTPTDGHSEFEEAVLHCLERFELHKPVRLVGIRLGHLESAGA